ncbi:MULTISPECIES: DsbC family protein [unclassified Variovorax]|uniref:DsbC family protein n=1 Tax=unclassified Variovorax TaxID=663243 RepID=UPI00131616A1|nr:MULTISPECIES: DsbC family protein [unclassified Variovorax]VTU29713.1 putative thiol:disulfide interchange protein DsbC precursor [Variovorax sp. SRS16]VTU37384.1 putative thiol:disulfide interchange protein DsbC precursor [Variovorax sp. PBL-E5]
MKKLVRPLFAAVAFGCVLASAMAGEAEIRKNLAARIPQFAKIDEVTKAPMPGLYEVRLNGFEIYYTDEQGNYLLQGNLIDVKARKNLTEERVEKLSEVAFDKLPMQDAFKIVRGNGKRRLAVFEDPNCGYCKQFEREMKSVDNVTVYLFLYPVLGPDSTVKARDIWCSKDKAKTWNDWMATQVKPASAGPGCDVAALQRNLEFGRKYNISGTPTLIFSDGTRAPGAIPAAEVEKQLAALN